jgi:tRNA 2-thiouridine synthesizing protein E
MPRATYAGHSVDVDTSGFLLRWRLNPSCRGNRGGIRIVANAGSLEGDRIRPPGHALENGASPGPRRISLATGISIKDLYRLFPQGPGKLVARISGVARTKAPL